MEKLRRLGDMPPRELLDKKYLVFAQEKDPLSELKDNVYHSLWTPEQETKFEREIRETYKQPHTPEVIDKTWALTWEYWAGKIGKRFEVPELEYCAYDLDVLETHERMVVKRPQEVSGDKGRPLLYKIFPETKGELIESLGPITNEPIIDESGQRIYERGGSFDVEKFLTSPNLYLTENRTSELFVLQGLFPQDLNTNIIASNFTALVNERKQPFDLFTYSRVLGSRQRNKIISTKYNEKVSLHVLLHDSWERRPYLGARSMGRKPIGIIK